MAAPHTKAFAYLRVSSKGQVNGYGYDRQADTINAYAKSHGIEIVEEFQDAYTGTEGERPRFMDMLAKIMADGVRMIIIECMDRLARDLMVQCMLLAKLESEGVTLISATTGEDVTASMREDPMRKALVQIQGVFAELDKSLLVRKLRKGREAKRAATGRCEGAKPYGQTERERRIIATIKRLRRKPRGGEALSYWAVADILNANQLPPRRGARWHASTVRAVCQSEGFRSARVGDAINMRHQSAVPLEGEGQE